MSSKQPIGDVKHPCTFSETHLAAARSLLETHWPNKVRYVLDPFAGIGTIHQLRPHYQTFGVELEPEWALQSKWTMVGSALNIPVPGGTFDAVVTSPTFGNRMADKHEARDSSKRVTYKHMLGRDLTDGSSAGMQWGDDYRNFHATAWSEVSRVVIEGGAFILHIADHIRNGEAVPVTAWHVSQIEALGFEEVGRQRLSKRGMRFGANRDARIDVEDMIAFRRT